MASSKLLVFAVLLLKSGQSSALSTTFHFRCIGLRGGGPFNFMKGEKKQELVEQVKAPPETQFSLTGHAYECALAGGMDGIRSGVSQGVGSELARLVHFSFQHFGLFGHAARSLAFFGMFLMNPWRGKLNRGGSDRDGRDSLCLKNSNDQILSSVDRVCVCFVTTPGSEVADKLCNTLVEQQVVACVNQIPGITSVYIWEGKVQRDSEILLVMKTTRSKVGAISEVLKEGHPYSCPELVALDVVDGLPDYLAWVTKSVSAAPNSDPPAQAPR